MEAMDLDRNVRPFLVREAETTQEDIAAIVDDLRRTGFVVVRGLSPNVATFERFSDRFGLHFVAFDAQSVHRSNVPGVHGSITTVDEGWGPIGWHAENGLIPRRPERLAFFCVHRPAVAGETLLVDGARVHAHLPEHLRESARKVRLLYTGTFDRRVPEQIAMLLAGFQAGSLDELEAMSRSLPIADDEEWRMELGAHEISYRYSYPLIRKSSWSGETVICAFFVGRLLDASGAPLAPELREAIMAASYEQAYFHQWADGDLVLVDNTRVMHARNAFNDRRRRILVRMGRCAA